MAIPTKITKDALTPSYTVELLDGDGYIVNLTGKTVQFNLRDDDGVLKVDAPATIIDAVLGVVRYVWVAGDTDTIGLYQATWVVTAGGEPTTYPSDQGDLIEVVGPPAIGYTLQGACSPWTTVAAVRSCCASTSAITGTPGYVSDVTVRDAINVATDLLYTLSGSQFPGECTTTVRPCRQPSCFGAAATWVTSIPNVADRSSLPAPECGCGRLAKVDLGFWPVAAVEQVVIDGTEVPPEAYRVDQWRYLVRLANPDGSNDSWPTCQRLDLPPTEEGTWEVSLRYGLNPPAAGVNAVNRLACELLKACLGQTCQLPSRVTSVTRQQVSISMIDPGMLKDGLTGIYEVDLFIVASNPGRARGTTIIYSPDLPKAPWRDDT